MPKPIAALFIGDLHAGSDTGLCVPGHPIGSKQKRPYIASGDQQWLYERWGDLLKAIKARAKGHLLFVGLGGDMIDGVQHHGTTQTSGTYSDQVSMARELVKPFVGLADYAYGVLGTAAHVGDVGDSDAALYESLSIDYAASYRLQIGGRVLWWAHHGIPVGTRQHTLENGAVNMARDIELTCQAQGVGKPSAVVGHDKHRAFEPVTVRGISIGVCPCWQMSTYYGLSRWPHSTTTVGALWWDVSSNHLELLTYAKGRTLSESAVVVISAEQQPDQPLWWAAIESHVRREPCADEFNRQMLADKLGIDADAAKAEIARLLKAGVIRKTQMYNRQMWYRAVRK